MKTEATFVTSAAGATDMPRHDLREVAMVGRSNVGKSSLINALVREKVARTSAAAGKTRLANFYRVARGRVRVGLIDLPGYGYARGGSSDFDELARAVFERGVSALLLVDSRHPGLATDLRAWDWVRGAVAAAVVATKFDKLARGERIRALGKLESAFHEPVLPVSAVTGEGLDKLWKLIDRLADSSQPKRPISDKGSSHNRNDKGSKPRKAMALRVRKG